MSFDDRGEEKRTFYAHSLPGKPPQEWQRLEEHLMAVACLARQFGEEFGAGDWAYLAGLWHDLGKYSDGFQEMLEASLGENAHIESRSGRVDHSTAGAILAEKSYQTQFKPFEKVLAYAIAGHHAGLSDWIAGLDVRLQKNECLAQVIDRIPPQIRNQPFPEGRPRAGAPPNPLALSLWIRMIFSCILDADFLDTEAFVDSTKRAARNAYPELSDLMTPFNNFMANLKDGAIRTSVNKLREAVRIQCVAKSQHEPAIFTLTVPTGGGKTLSSMAFALNHALRYLKRHIIYVIPYTSIIEQTADVFRNVLGDAVLEHHSNIDETDPGNENLCSRLACENWDAPIIVTTAVQFFESLFASKTSRCRKLHNIANSIVILDEAQLLPPNYLIPILEVLKELNANYSVTLVLSTATQPALSPHKGSDFVFPGLPDTVEIIDDPSALYNSLRRVQFSFPSNLELPESWEEVALRLKTYKTVLCIVNSRRDCRVLYGMMPEGTIHLSALMCGAHRSRIIGKIKQQLKAGVPTRVVSTQLVEAGVDLDFPVVFRALAGLDEIAQAAGRCNREGRMEHGEAVVFIPPSSAPAGHLRQAAEIGRRLLATLATDHIPLRAFNDYFRELYWIKGKDLDRHQVVSLLRNDPSLRFSFRTAADAFRIIEQQGWPCLIRYCEGGALIDQLCESGKNRYLMRKLQRFTVQVSDWHLKKLLAGGDIIEPENLSGIFAQSNTALYREDIGLCFPEEIDAYSPEDLII
jgi:CRISPR-associated endonuclease/helicase Cas3